MGENSAIEWTDATGRNRGVLKTAAHRLGLTLGEYLERRARGEKHCRVCRGWLHISSFGVDASRGDGLASICRGCHSGCGREKRQPVPTELRRPMGPPAHPARDGDKKQARHRVNVLVRTGRLPHPNSLPCKDCGHVVTAGSKRHEYDHHLGYAAENHLRVEAVCTTCHCNREWKRGTFSSRAAGRLLDGHTWDQMPGVQHG